MLQWNSITRARRDSRARWKQQMIYPHQAAPLYSRRASEDNQLFSNTGAKPSEHVERGPLPQGPSSDLPAQCTNSARRDATRPRLCQHHRSTRSSGHQGRTAPTGALDRCTATRKYWLAYGLGKLGRAAACSPSPLRPHPAPRARTRGERKVRRGTTRS